MRIVHRIGATKFIQYVSRSVVCCPCPQHKFQDGQFCAAGHHGCNPHCKHHIVGFGISPAPQAARFLHVLGSAAVASAVIEWLATPTSSKASHSRAVVFNLYPNGYGDGLDRGAKSGCRRLLSDSDAPKTVPRIPVTRRRRIHLVLPVWLSKAGFQKVDHRICWENP